MWHRCHRSPPWRRVAEQPAAITALPWQTEPDLIRPDITPVEADTAEGIEHLPQQDAAHQTTWERLLRFTGSRNRDELLVAAEKAKLSVPAEAATGEALSADTAPELSGCSALSTRA